MACLNRRQILFASAPLAFALGGFPGGRVFAALSPSRFAEAKPFSFETLQQTAKDLATKSYVQPRQPAADVINTIDFDVIQHVKFRADRELFADGGGPFPVRLFHVDKFNPLPVTINVLSGGMARRLIYSPDDFDYGNTGLAEKLPKDIGFSGFRVMDSRQAATDWLAFQGASYFRSSGQDNQYGGSARGIAVDTAASSKEEFPRFVEFWLAEPQAGKSSITIYALLDGPSLTGAYQIEAEKQSGALMQIRANLFIRNDIAQLGVAPLTSMYWYGENDRRFATDWRPEVHDSDGLALWTGKGERIWRPLTDPSSVLTNSFLDENPKAFGLMQRDRVFADYQDDGAFYNRRPSMWVEPQGDWGAGAVQLIEIPTRDEIHDNIVVFWKPKRAIKTGDQLDLSYKLYWRDDEPHPPADIGCVVATRVGQGGVPGKPAPTDKDSFKFVIDFEGGPLSKMAARFDVTPVVTVSRGKIVNPYVIKVVGTDRWRALFDIYAPGKQQVDLRCYLRLDDKTLTETWLYQYFPPALSQ